MDKSNKPGRPDFWDDKWREAPTGSPMQGKVLIGSRWVDPPKSAEEADRLIRANRIRSAKWIVSISAIVLGATALVLLPAIMGSESGTNTMLILVALGVGIFIYVMICREVANAAARKGRSRNAWFWIAFLFGILIPAVIVAAIAPTPGPAVVLASSSQPAKAPQATVACPFCGEQILPVARKCKHCHSMLDE